MSFVSELAGQPGYVMVPDKGLRRDAIEHLVVPVERPGQLEEVPVVQRAPDRLPQLILSDRVQAAVRGVGHVVAVDHFPDEPSVGMRFPHPGQDLGPEAGRHRVRGIKPPSRRTPVQPVDHDLGHVVDHLGLFVIEGDKLVMALEGLVVATHRIAPEPPGRGPACTVGERGLKRRERTADVVEHPVQDDAQAPPAGLSD